MYIRFNRNQNIFSDRYLKAVHIDLKQFVFHFTARCRL